MAMREFYTRNKKSTQKVHTVVVDDEDLHLLVGCHLVFNQRGTVSVRVRGDESLQIVIMKHHGLLVEGLVIDHIDGDRLNNKKSNLRCVTLRQNARNTDSLGVYPHGSGWRAEVVRLTESRDRKDIFNIVADYLEALSFGNVSRLRTSESGKVYFRSRLYGPTRSSRCEALRDRVELKRKLHDGELGYGLRAQGFR